MTGEDVAARVHAYAWTDRKPGLERTRALLAALGNPEKALKFVHITGSNGKGSTAAMLASVLAAAGYRTGLFTSPHLYRFNERFQVNGAPIPDAALDRLAERVLAAAQPLRALRSSVNGSRARRSKKPARSPTLRSPTSLRCRP